MTARRFPAYGRALGSVLVGLANVAGPAGLVAQPVRVEGASFTAWKVEERVQRTGTLLATWYLTLSSPFMVLGEVVLPDGRTQRITGEALE
ncbi:MAG: hypothetical protein WEB90_03580 [Gemmatimonadota bacterium]